MRAQTLPVVAHHYSGLRSPAIAQLRRSEQVYASYRKGGLVYWTAAAFSVPAREYVWVSRDGEVVRARCGNRLSRIARGPTLLAPEAPRPADLEESIPDLPIVPDTMPHRPDLEAQLIGALVFPWDLPSAPVPGSRRAPSYWMWSLPLYGGAAGAWIIPSAGIVIPGNGQVVPEPSTRATLGVFLLLLVTVEIRRLRKRNRHELCGAKRAEEGL